MKMIKGSGGGKGGGGSARVASESPDDLQSKQYARIIDLVSEGEIVGLVDGLKSIYFDNTPLQNSDGSLNVEGVTFDTRQGTQGQTQMAAFTGVEFEQAVGVEIKKDTAIVRSVASSDVDAVRVTVSVPRLTSQNTSNGDVSGTSVRLAIDIQDDGGGYVTQKLSNNNIDLTNDGAGVASSVDRDILDAQLSISWLGEDRGFQTLGYRVDYRAVGDTTWNALSSGSFSGTGKNTPDTFNYDAEGGGR